MTNKLLLISFFAALVTSIAYGGPSSTRDLTGARIINGSAILSLPTATTSIVGTGTTQPLSNKTMDGSLNTFTNIPGATAIAGTIPQTVGGTGFVSYTAGDMVSANAGTSLAKTGVGSLSQVWSVTNAGTGALGWITLPRESVNYTWITSTQAWTVPADLKTTDKVTFFVQGAGGSGGGGDASNSGGGAGGGGGCAIKTLTGLVGGGTLSITIGASAAASGAASNGNSGGNTTVASGTSNTISTITGNGGGGGRAGTGQRTWRGGNGGASSGGDVNLRGQGGGPSVYVGTAGNGMGGTGGNGGCFGGGGRGGWDVSGEENADSMSGSYGGGSGGGGARAGAVNGLSTATETGVVLIVYGK